MKQKVSVIIEKISLILKYVDMAAYVREDCGKIFATNYTFKKTATIYILIN